MKFFKLINNFLPKILRNNIGAVSFDGIDDKLQRTTAVSSSYPITQYCRAKVKSLGIDNKIFSQTNIGSARNYIFLSAISGNQWQYLVRDNAGTQAILNAGTVDLNWHTFVTISSSSNDHRLYLDGVLIGTNTTNVAFPTGLNRVQLGHWVRSTSSLFGNVDISEFAIWSSVLSTDQVSLLNNGIKGTVLGIDKANLLAYIPLDDYPDKQSVDGLTFRDDSNNGIILTGDDGGNNTGLISIAEPTMSYQSEIIIPIIENVPDVDEADNLQISDSIIVIDTIVQEADNLQISDSIFTQDTTVQESENLQISDSIIVTDTNTDAKFISKIISVNPLIFITDTDPIEIIKVDTTDPQNITFIVRTVPGVSSGKDVAINTTNDFMYIAGNAGQVVKVELADLSNQTILDLNDTDDLLTIETNSNFGLTYAGTENEVGELYVIDERDTFLIDSDFRVNHPTEFLMETDFNIVKPFRIDSDFQLLQLATFQVDTDFKCKDVLVPIVFPPEPPDPSPPPTPTPIVMEDTVIPINLEDYQVFIDGSELADTDLILNSIIIQHRFGQESTASFALTRKHDQLNTTLEGNSVPITGQNTVIVKCKGVTIFPQGTETGKISQIDARYNNNGEFVIVNALAPEATHQFNNITMSLPGLNERLSPFNILVQNPKIFNPVPDEDDEDNPSKFKGIRVNLGTRIRQRVNRFIIFDGTGLFASRIQDGTFNPIYNWTYFWRPTVTKFGTVNLGEISERTFFYIGTSLAPVSEDLWDLSKATHRRQRIYDDDVEEIGFYEAGEAPFKEISVRNGEKITKFKWVDEVDRLSSIKDAGFNFVEFAKSVADLELLKLTNINGDVLPETSSGLTMTIDAYLFYSISLLTKINVDNTTEANIYNNNNGFPLSAKSITITSSNRKVTVQADNLKSTAELKEIDGEFPDEDDDEYNIPERRVLVDLKSDMRTRLNVE